MTEFHAKNPARARPPEDSRLAAAAALRPAGQEFDLRGSVQRIRRLSQLDTTVFAELRADTTQTLMAVLVAVGAIMLSAVGGWLWLVTEGDGLSTGRIALREFFLGSVFTLALWFAWVVIARSAMQALYGRQVDGGSLLRTMGFAAAPAAMAVVMIIPALSFGLALLSLTAWFMLSTSALAAVTPSATRREVLVANGVGFVLFVMAMSALADAGGFAAGVFVHGADLSAYI